jgi:plasmid stabilization system protein ParE
MTSSQSIAIRPADFHHAKPEPLRSSPDEYVWSRDALDELKGISRVIALDNANAARNVAQKIRKTAMNLGIRPVGRRGRVSGTYEMSVAGLPYILAYAIETLGGKERIVILRVIHTARNWPDESWPRQ